MILYYVYVVNVDKNRFIEIRTKLQLKMVALLYDQHHVQVTTAIMQQDRGLISPMVLRPNSKTSEHVYINEAGRGGGEGNICVCQSSDSTWISWAELMCISAHGSLQPASTHTSTQRYTLTARLTNPTHTHQADRRRRDPMRPN